MDFAGRSRVDRKRLDFGYRVSWHDPWADVGMCLDVLLGVESLEAVFRGYGPV